MSIQHKYLLSDFDLAIWRQIFYSV